MVPTFLSRAKRANILDSTEQTRLHRLLVITYETQIQCEY